MNNIIITPLLIKFVLWSVAICISVLLLSATYYIIQDQERLFLQLYNFVPAFMIISFIFIVYRLVRSAHE